MKDVTKFLRIVLLAGTIVLGFGGIASAHHDYIEIDVWADHGFDDPYCAYDEFDLFLRPERNCYVTVMIIDPDGYANIIYPVNNRHQRRLRRGRVYKLSDLLDDPFYFYDIEGRAYISVVATRRPVFLNPWLLDEVRTFSYRPYRFNAFGIKLSLGNLGYGGRFSIHWSRHIRSYGYGAFTASIVLNHNHYQRHHRFYERRPFTRRDWAKRWAYRSNAPVIIHKNRKTDNIHVKKRAYAIQRQKGITHKITKEDENSNSRKASRRMKKKTAYRNK